MANMASTAIQKNLGQVLVDFSTNGAFPEEESVSAAYMESSILPEALVILNNAKSELEAEIREISRENAPDVDAWIVHAKSIQEDIDRSRKLASSIVRQAEADDERLEGIQERETYVEFMEKEVAFNDQLLSALKALQAVQDRLVKVEETASQGMIVNSLFSLDESWKSLAELPLEPNTTRAVRLLDTKCFDLRAAIHDQFTIVWNGLIRVDYDAKTVTINKELPNQDTTLEKAVVALKAYKMLPDACKKLWENIDKTVLAPRTDLESGSVRAIKVEKNMLSLGEVTLDHTVKSLFIDLEQVISFINDNLPSIIIGELSDRMMPTLSNRILTVWLEHAVPSSLDDMVSYQKALAQVNNFASRLDSLHWPGADSLHDWVANAPRIWLNKRRETSLDWVRNHVALGLGKPQLAERVEKRMVAREEGNHISATGTLATQDWDAAWDSGDEHDEKEGSHPASETPSGSTNRHSLEEERNYSPIIENQEDDAADAWGWGDDEESVEPEEKRTPPRPQLTRHLTPETKEMTLSEKYWASSMPQSILKAVVDTFNDGATLKKPENAHIPIAPAAPGLFSLPTLILATYRSVGPYYYSTHPCGNMYLYNDTLWLSTNLQTFITDWESRDDIPPNTYNMNKLESDIKVLESFGKRAYTDELNSQRTVINDLLGGSYNFFQQDGQGQDELEASLKIVIRHVRGTAASWEKILAYSAWVSATGSLVNAIATKLVADVFDLTDIGVDEAERIATLLSRVEELDDLFIPKRDKGQKNGVAEDVPMTAQFADKWMKMKFLSEVLQSNLKDVKFLWFESDLSLYFTVDEVVDLINLSFESNTAVRQAIREIREKPDPRAEEM